MGDRAGWVRDFQEGVRDLPLVVEREGRDKFNEDRHLRFTPTSQRMTMPMLSIKRKVLFRKRNNTCRTNTS